jgi:signal peptidase I
MIPSILVGDRIWVNKLAYDLKLPFTTLRMAEWASPQRGEIAVFFSPYDGTRLVKRVIGLPGDVLQLSKNRLFINGEPVDYRPAEEEAAQALGNGVGGPRFTHARTCRANLTRWPQLQALRRCVTLGLTPFQRTTIS